MALETEPYDVADYLDSDEMISAYLSEELSSNEPLYMAKALAAVARARGGIDRLAEETSLPIEKLRPAANPEHVDRELVLAVTQALISRFSASRAA